METPTVQHQSSAPGGLTFTAVSNQAFEALSKLDVLAAKGTVRYLLVLGGAFLVLAFSLKIFAVLSHPCGRAIDFSIGDYAVTLGAGIVLLFGGVAVRAYEFKVAEENYRSAIAYERKRLEAHAQQSDRTF